MKIDGQTVLLTGATGGLGAAMARALAERGARLVLSARRTGALKALVAETGGRAVAADLADRASVHRLAARSGQVDIVVANAALPATGALEDFSEEEVDRALDVNLRSPILLAKLLSPGMVARRRGHIVFISSLSGKVASSGGSLYSATKFGLRGFALSLREDLRPNGVGVSVVFPGFIREAGMFADAGVKLPKGVRTKSPAHVAAAVVRAIERNRAEIDVAPIGLRAGAKLAGLAPELSAAVQRRAGGAGVAEELAAAQRHKR